MIEQKPVARYIAKRLTPEGTDEFFGVMLVPTLPPLTLFFTADQLKAERDKAIEETLWMVVELCDSDAVLDAVEDYSGANEVKIRILEILFNNERKILSEKRLALLSTNESKENG